MRRRQQQPTTEQLQGQNRHDASKAKSWRRTRRSPVLRIAVIVSAVLLLIIVYCAVGPSSSSFRKDTSSLRRGGGAERRQRRVVAIGDIHGDKDALIRALQLANLVDRNEGGVKWIGGSNIVVQIGDLLNKAEERDKETLAYITDIERKARDVGGAVVVTVGDHDLHNAPKLWRDLHSKEAFPSWMHAVYVIDRTLFVHGSLSKGVFEGAIGGSIESMNREAEAWLAGTGEKPKWIGRGDGPVWSRLYSDNASDEEHPQKYCGELYQLLNELSVDRMIVGHTVKKDGITSICNENVWRIDVGLSQTETRAGKIGASEVLEISQGGTVVTILSTDIKLKSWKQ